jgi:hypothetical protein
MKKIIYISIFVVSQLLTGCKEEPPNIVFKDPTVSDYDTTYIASSIAKPQTKVVLVEDFTGAKCTNCPAAHDEVADMIKNNPGRIVALSLHPTKHSLAAPIDPKFDFRLNEAQDLADNFGGFQGLPAGGVDRVKGNAQLYVYAINASLWSGFLQTRLSKTTPYNIDINNSYNATNNTITSTVTVELTSATTDTLLLSVLYTENKVVAPQELGNQSVDSFYSHNHLVRKFVTPASGKQLPSKHEVGRVFVYRSVRKIDSSWNPNNMTVVAFVHSAGADKQVYHAAEKPVK